MNAMDTSVFVIGLAMLSVAGIFYVIVYPALSGNAKRDQRTKALQSPVQKRGDRTVDARAAGLRSRKV